MPWILIAGGVLLAAYVLTQLVRYRGSGHWPITPAVIETTSVRRHQTDGLYFSPYVSFSFEVSGEHYSGEWWTGPNYSTEDEARRFLEQNMPVGSRLNVRYKPRNPSLNMLEVDPTLWDKGKPITLGL
jgi:Protein of unknown function (DUF3592)